mmetsp:Transcript_20394/g.61440  ORF Transcript_20394/g.61440 Transcript_20394/m.61440 type:complete len:230 (-) Transcript_20394:133-822(-)
MAVSFQSGSAGRNLMSPLLSTPSGTVMMTALPAIFSPEAVVMVTPSSLSCTEATGVSSLRSATEAARASMMEPYPAGSTQWAPPKPPNSSSWFQCRADSLLRGALQPYSSCAQCQSSRRRISSVSRCGSCTGGSVTPPACSVSTSSAAIAASATAAASSPLLSPPPADTFCPSGAVSLPSVESKGGPSNGAEEGTDKSVEGASGVSACSWAGDRSEAAVPASPSTRAAC